MLALRNETFLAYAEKVASVANDGPKLFELDESRSQHNGERTQI